MLRTASSLPPKGLLTLGSGPARFQTTPPACYRASWQLPGPDSHRQATTSLRTTRSTTTTTSRCHLLFCWAHEKGSVRPHCYDFAPATTCNQPASADQRAGFLRLGLPPLGCSSTPVRPRCPDRKLTSALADDA